MDPTADEQVFFHGHPSWRSILGFYIKGLLAAVLAGAIAGVVTRIASNKVQVGWVVAAVLVAFAVVLIAGVLQRITVTYTITNQRLTINTGIFSREMQETRLARVQNVGTDQSFIDRILRVGVVNFDTAAEAGFDFKFRGVSNPHEIVRTVDAALHELQGHGAPSASDV